MRNTTVKMLPWINEQVPSEPVLRNMLAAEGLRSHRWHNGPHDIYGTHAHSYHKVVCVVEGTITFGLPDLGQQLQLQAGDRLNLPAGLRHDAVVGPDGVVCLEAHQK